MLQRNLDGVYFRMQRDGKWMNICFSDMTEEEQDKIMENRPVEWLQSMCRILARTIRQIGDELDLYGG